MFSKIYKIWIWRVFRNAYILLFVASCSLHSNSFKIDACCLWMHIYRNWIYPVLYSLYPICIIFICTCQHFYLLYPIYIHVCQLITKKWPTLLRRQKLYKWKSPPMLSSFLQQFSSHLLYWIAINNNLSIVGDRIWWILKLVQYVNQMTSLI